MDELPLFCMVSCLSFLLINPQIAKPPMSYIFLNKSENFPLQDRENETSVSKMKICMFADWHTKEMFGFSVEE